MIGQTAVLNGGAPSSPAKLHGGKVSTKSALERKRCAALKPSMITVSARVHDSACAKSGLMHSKMPRAASLKTAPESQPLNQGGHKNFQLTECEKEVLNCIALGFDPRMCPSKHRVLVEGLSRCIFRCPFSSADEARLRETAIFQDFSWEWSRIREGDTQAWHLSDAFLVETVIDISRSRYGKHVTYDLVTAVRVRNKDSLEAERQCSCGILPFWAWRVRVKRQNPTLASCDKAYATHARHARPGVPYLCRCDPVCGSEIMGG